MRRILVAGAALAALAVAGPVSAATGPPPKQATVRAVQTTQVKINRFVKDNLRWARDTYFVRSGGTVKLINDAPNDGPHTFTFVKRSDLPKTPAQILGSCKICETLGQAHGADPNTEGPPKFLFLENGVGQEGVPNFDAPGDSAFVDAKKGASVTLPVTAKKGTTHYFMCLIHPWMQGKLLVR